MAIGENEAMRKNILLKATSPCILAEAEVGRRAGELCIATTRGLFPRCPVWGQWQSIGCSWAYLAVPHQFKLGRKTRESYQLFTRSYWFAPTVTMKKRLSPEVLGSESGWPLPLSPAGQLKTQVSEKRSQRGEVDSVRLPWEESKHGGPASMLVYLQDPAM